MPGLGDGIIHGVVGYVTFVLTVLVCHRVLYEARPEASKLTAFYLLMSLGGVLGGIFAALIAPQLFSSVVEYPLLMLAGLLARPGWIAGLKDHATRVLSGKLFAAVAFGALLAWVLGGLGLADIEKSLVFWLLSIAVGAGIIAVMGTMGRGTGMASATVALMVIFTFGGLNRGEMHVERSFFGVSRVQEAEAGQVRMYVHGSTVHGMERIKDEDGNTGPFLPTMYYHENAPMPLGVKVAREALGNAGRQMNVGVIGQGTGSIACYLQPQEKLTFYEIDPVVDRISRNSDYFTFISRCKPDTVTKIGDARIVLERETGTTYDYFLVDAFSSDAVPVHLLTREAIMLYLSRINENGVVGLHISNRHMDLETVVKATAMTIPGVHIAYVADPKENLPKDGMASNVVFLSKNPKVIELVERHEHARPIEDKGVAAWTDDYADVFGAIMRRYWSR